MRRLRTRWSIGWPGPPCANRETITGLLRLFPTQIEKDHTMTTHYHSPQDLDRLAEFKKLAGPEFTAYAKFDGSIGREDGAIDPLNRELIAVGVAVSSQCPSCIQVHVTKAKQAGASKAQIAEATMIAAALGAGAAVTHGTLAFRIFDEADKA
jgi:AhpD family alkylhydroperoxidase